MRDHTVDYPNHNPRPDRLPERVRVAVGGHVAGRPVRTARGVASPCWAITGDVAPLDDPPATAGAGARGVVMNDCRVTDCPSPGLYPAGVCTLRDYYDEAALRG